MNLFSFFKGKKQSSLDEVIEKEYNKAQQKIQLVDKGRCFALARDMKRYAERAYPPKEECDLLKQKAEFMRVYTFRSYQWRLYYTLNHKNGSLSDSSSWTHKWHDFEQKERLVAQKRWRQLVQQKTR